MQDAQDERQVREDLNVYSISRNKRTRSDRTLMRRGGWGACKGQALALRLRRRADRAAVVRGPVPRDRSLILDILIILAILLQTR